MPKLLITIISFLVILVLGIGLLWPKYQDFKDIQEDIAEKEIELQYKEEYFSELQKVYEQLNDYAESLAKIDSAFPSQPNLPALFEFLQKSSSQNGLILKDVTAGSANSSKKFPGIQETNLSLAFSGSYPAFKNFLATLQKTARLIEIGPISFSSPEKKEIFLFNLDIKVHSY